MKLSDLTQLPPFTLAESQRLYRVQRNHCRPGALITGALHLAPIGDQAGRFSLLNDSTGYFADSPETALYETLVRREAVSLSLSNVAARQLLCLRPIAPIELIDLRPYASTWPVLQSQRFSATQGIAAEVWSLGFGGIVYCSAQQYGHDSFVLFGASLNLLKLVWRKALVLPDGSMHSALHSAIRGGQIPLVP